MAGPKVLGQALGTGAANNITLYTSPTAAANGAGSAVSSIVLINSTAGALTFTAAIVPASDTQAAKHTLIPTVTIAANDLLSFQIGVSLGPGDKIVFAAGTGGGVHAYGMEL